MIEFGSFALLRPWWLMAFPVMAAAILATRQKPAGLADWVVAVDPPLLAAMLKRQGGGAEAPTGHAIHWTVALLALALAGPAIKRSDMDQFRNLDSTLIVLDLSNEASKGASLREAVAAAQLILAQSGVRQKGLIVYAGDAYLASPPTNDADALSALLFAVDEKTVPDAGVRPDRALSLAGSTLRETQTISGDVVLISGGGGLDHSATREATRLAADGHALHTLYSGAPGKDETSRIADRTFLTTLATAGQGVAASAQRPEAVLKTISGRTIGHVAQSHLQLLAWRDCGRFALIAAAAGLLLCFHRGAR